MKWLTRKEVEIIEAMAPWRGNNKRGGGSNCKTSSHRSDLQNACCGMCGGATDDSNSVGCDSCPLRFHNTSLCTGLPQSTILALKDVRHEDVGYECTGCRIRSGGQSQGKARYGAGLAGDGGSVGQLHETVKALCATVKDLERKVSALTKSQASMNTVDLLSSLTNYPDISPAIRKEIIEMEERRKRKESVIFRGLVSADIDDAKEKISQVTTVVLGSPLPVSNLFCIDQGRGIYRAECTNVTLRDDLLQKASVLQDTDEYKDIYINRYLASSSSSVFCR